MFLIVCLLCWFAKFVDQQYAERFQALNDSTPVSHGRQLHQHVLTQRPTPDVILTHRRWTFLDIFRSTPTLSPKPCWYPFDCLKYFSLYISIRLAAVGVGIPSAGFRNFKYYLFRWFPKLQLLPFSLVFETSSIAIFVGFQYSMFASFITSFRWTPIILLALGLLEFLHLRRCVFVCVCVRARARVCVQYREKVYQ